MTAVDDIQKFKQRREQKQAEGDRLPVEAWNRLAALAYAGYLKWGRGLLLCDLDGAPLKATYYTLTADTIVDLFTPEFIAKIGVEVAMYNPDRELITLLFDEGEPHSYDRKRASLIDPREMSPIDAYELIGEQGPEPTGPPASVHRLSDWDGAA